MKKLHSLIKREKIKMEKEAKKEKSTKEVWKTTKLKLKWKIWSKVVDMIMKNNHHSVLNAKI